MAQLMFDMLNLVVQYYMETEQRKLRGRRIRGPSLNGKRRITTTDMDHK